MSGDYDAAEPSRFTEEDCRAVVSRKATITLTGRIVDYGVSETGPFVKFQPDDRFGFGDFRFVIDLDALRLAGEAG